MLRQTIIIAGMILALSVLAATYAEHYAPVIVASFKSEDGREAEAIRREFMKLLRHKCDAATGKSLAGESCI